jgi:hypothetical protein
VHGSALAVRGGDLLLQRIYAALLHLYPSAFRDEFADEMHRDFSHALADAHKHGTFALISLLARELRDLPAAALREHRRTRSSSPMENNPRSSLRELLCAALPFLLYLAIPGASFVQEYWAVLVRLLLIGALIVLAIVGLTKGVPRWALPVLGLSLAIVNYVLLNLVDPNFNPYASLPPWLRQLLAPSLSSVPTAPAGLYPLAFCPLWCHANIQTPQFQRVRR